MKMISTSYSPKDVTILLKDISGMISPSSTEEREKRIQSGTHYCEMLPIEYTPSEEYMKIYEYALKNFSQETARAVCVMSERIYMENHAPVLVSLARAGLPAGILAKRYLEKKYSITVPHYSVSIIRGRGIDRNAMDYILSRHDPVCIRFVDGWTGKGAIQTQLNDAMTDYHEIDPRVAVIADPAMLTPFCGTHEDFLIASSCLNSTVSGLISRTVLRSDLIGENDFHGAVYYGELAPSDRSYEFIDEVERHFIYDLDVKADDTTLSYKNEDVDRISAEFEISDRNLIKPGIGETTRVLLRRVPYKVLIAEGCEEKYISHIIELAREKNVPTQYYPLKSYRCCGIIKNMPSDA